MLCLLYPLGLLSAHVCVTFCHLMYHFLFYFETHCLVSLSVGVNSYSLEPLCQCVYLPPLMVFPCVLSSPLLSGIDILYPCVIYFVLCEFVIFCGLLVFLTPVTLLLF